MIRILVAEEEEGLRILLSEELQEEGYEVLTYGSFALKPAGALDSAGEGPVEVEFDLERIKLKIRDLLGRSHWPHDNVSGREEPRRDHIPGVQINFSFQWSGERT